MEDIVPERPDSTDWVARGTTTGSEAVDWIVRVARAPKIRGRVAALPVCQRQTVFATLSHALLGVGGLLLRAVVPRILDMAEPENRKQDGSFFSTNIHNISLRRNA
jgi:hypothetical protein